MELRICPKCKRAFFARKFSSYVECGVCGFVLKDDAVEKKLKSIISNPGDSYV